MSDRARLLVGTAVVIAVAELFVNVDDLGGGTIDGSLAAWSGLSAFGIAVAAVLLLGVLPRVDQSAHPILATSFGVTALFTCVAFWSALPFAFGAGAVAAARRPTSPAALLGILGAVVAFVFCVIA
ncbi:MAG: hypothetical protein M3389_10805 [Actinomycetota bacterium]|nr:hypothetical protein [Actinomycetota bacterium]